MPLAWARASPTRAGATSAAGHGGAARPNTHGNDGCDTRLQGIASARPQSGPFSHTARLRAWSSLAHAAQSVGPRPHVRSASASAGRGGGPRPHLRRAAHAEQVVIVSGPSSLQKAEYLDGHIGVPLNLGDAPRGVAQLRGLKVHLEFAAWVASYSAAVCMLHPLAPD